jgi:hypothetical protein
MSCCGGKRSRYKRSVAKGTDSNHLPVQNRQSDAAKAAAAYSTVPIQYLHNTPIKILGSVTGRAYTFTTSQRQQPVDRRDVARFLSIPCFQQADR